MRLTDEDVRRHKENKYNVECIKGKVKMSDGDIIGNLCDTIEALQQENERLKWAVQEWVDGICISQKYLSQIGKLQRENEQLKQREDEAISALDEICQLRVENERLKAQNEAMRGLIKQIADCGGEWSYGACEMLKDIDTVTYHNPADVEALKQTREALELIYKKHVDIPNHNKYPKTCVICREAIAAIDKIGGREDV